MSTINSIQNLLNYYQPSAKNVDSPSFNTPGRESFSFIAQNLSQEASNATATSNSTGATDSNASISSQQTLNTFANNLFTILKGNQSGQSTPNQTLDKLAGELQSLVQQMSNPVSTNTTNSTNVAKTASAGSPVESRTATPSPTESDMEKNAAFIGMPIQQYKEQMERAQSSDPFGVVAYNQKFGLTAPRASDPANQAQLDKTTIGTYSGTTVMPTLATFNAGIDPNEVYANAGLPLPEGSYVNGIWIPTPNTPSANDTTAAREARINALTNAGLSASDAAAQADQGFWQKPVSSAGI